MAAYSSAGSQLAISATLPTTFDENETDGYPSVSDHEIVGEITNIGEFGKQFSEIAHRPLATRGTQYRKGSFEMGTLNLEMALDEDDLGQRLLIDEALDSDASFNIKIIHQNGIEYHMTGQIMSFMRSVGETESITSATCTIRVDREPVMVRPA